MTDAELVGYAEALGLDAGRSSARWRTEPTRRGCTRTWSWGCRWRWGTPTFFINGFRLQGVPPVWVFEIALEAFRRGLLEAEPVRSVLATD